MWYESPLGNGESANSNGASTHMEHNNTTSNDNVCACLPSKRHTSSIFRSRVCGFVAVWTIPLNKIRCSFSAPNSFFNDILDSRFEFRIVDWVFRWVHLSPRMNCAKDITSWCEFQKFWEEKKNKTKNQNKTLTRSLVRYLKNSITFVLLPQLHWQKKWR